MFWYCSQRLTEKNWGWFTVQSPPNTIFFIGLLFITSRDTHPPSCEQAHPGVLGSERGRQVLHRVMWGLQRLPGSSPGFLTYLLPGPLPSGSLALSTCLLTQTVELMVVSLRGFSGRLMKTLYLKLSQAQSMSPNHSCCDHHHGPCLWWYTQTHEVCCVA